MNSAIDAFNSHLESTCRIPPINIEAGLNDKSIVKVVHGDWDAFPFPNNKTSGVYFIFGHVQNDAQKKMLYIGKASFESFTSGRLYAHLSPCRYENQFIFRGYIMDFIASIDLDKLRIPFLAPALEEYLITNLKHPFTLTNAIGNKKTEKTLNPLATALIFDPCT